MVASTPACSICRLAAIGELSLADIALTLSPEFVPVLKLGSETMREPYRADQCWANLSEGKARLSGLKQPPTRIPAGHPAAGGGYAAFAVVGRSPDCKSGGWVFALALLLSSHVARIFDPTPAPN